MTSVLSSFAQIGPRDKYLLAVAATATTVYTINSGYTLTSSMTDAEFNDATTAAATPTVGQLYRDLGKVTTTYDPDTGLSTEKFVLAQLVSGTDTEGSSGIFRYIRVWAANASNKVAFARVG